MSHNLVISDELYQRLLADAEARGLKSVQQLLEEPSENGVDVASRAAVVRDIDGLRERLFGRYGEMPDSTSLIREDRTR